MTLIGPTKALFALLILLSATACAFLAAGPSDPEASRAAESLLARLEEGNRLITDARGVGRFRLVNANGALSGRVAWLSAPPGRLRIALLSPFGQPVATIAGDGEQVEVAWAADGKILEGNADGSLTAAVFGMKIPWRVLVSALAFTARIEPHRGIRPELAKNPDSGLTEIFIPGGFFRPEQKFVFENGGNFPKQARYGVGKSQVSVEFDGKAGQAGSSVAITGKNGESLTLWPEQLVFNQGLDGASFSLAP